MSTNAQRVRDLVAEQAADWFIENRDGLNTEQRREFIAWLKASPVHVEEYLAVTALAQHLPAACERAGETREQLVSHARREEDTAVRSPWPRTPTAERELRSHQWQPLAVAASLVVLSVGSLTLGYFWPHIRRSIAGDATAMHFQTRHGEQQTHELADHSVIHLNTDTAVTIRFDNHERLVVLEAGEADFNVAHEVHRAFRVSAGSAQVVDIGTRFDVRLEPSATLVTVAEGRISVGLTSSAEHTIRVQLGAGQQIRVAEGAWPARPGVADVERTTAWLHRQIKFDNEPLARVTSEFNRYAATPFEIATPALQDLKISGVFATDDTDAFIAFLRSFPGVSIEVSASRIRVSQH